MAKARRGKDDTGPFNKNSEIWSIILYIYIYIYIYIHTHIFCISTQEQEGLPDACDHRWKTKYLSVQFSTVAQSCVTPWTAGCQTSCPSPTPRACSNSCPLSQWYYPTISSSVIPFSSCLQSFPASGSFQMSQFFESGGQSYRVSASASVLPMNIQDWLPSGWTGWSSLQFMELSRVFSDTTIQNHQFFGAQLSQLSHPHMTTRKTIALTRQTFVSNVSAFYHAV